MKAARRFFSAAAALLIGGVCMTSGYSFAEENSTGEMNFDVVFVLDVSGSMKHNDKQGLAKESIKLFLDMCDKENCRASFVSYGEEGRTYPDYLLDLCDSDNMVYLKSSVDSVPYDEDYTDASGGLEHASFIFDSEANAGSPLAGTVRKPMVILLSDGSTDLDNDFGVLSEKEQEAEAQIENMKNEFASRNIPVYTIGLLGDDPSSESVNEEQLSSIAQITGARYFRAVSAETLPGIIMDIFGAGNRIRPSVVSAPERSEAGKVKSGGTEFCSTFEVENSSVNCCNIIIKHEAGINDFIIEAPNGDLFNKDTVSEISRSGKYTMIKLKPNNKPGKWKLYMTTDVPEQAMEVSVYNTYRIYAESSIRGSAVSGRELTIATEIREDGNTVTADDILNRIKDENVRVYVDGNEVSSVVKRENGVFLSTVSSLKAGSHEIKIRLEADTFGLESNVLKESVSDLWSDVNVRASITNITPDINGVYTVPYDSNIKIQAEVDMNDIGIDESGTLSLESLFKPIGGGAEYSAPGFELSEDGRTYISNCNVKTEKKQYKLVVKVSPERGGEFFSKEEIVINVVPGNISAEKSSEELDISIGEKNEIPLSRLFSWDNTERIDVTFNTNGAPVSAVYNESTGCLELSADSDCTGTVDVAVGYADHPDMQRAAAQLNVSAVSPAVKLRNDMTRKVKKALPWIGGGAAVLLAAILLIIRKLNASAVPIGGEVLGVSIYNGEEPVGGVRRVVIPKNKGRKYADLFTMLRQKDYNQIAGYIEKNDLEPLLRKCVAVPTSRETDTISFIVKNKSGASSVNGRKADCQRAVTLDNEKCTIETGGNTRIIVELLRKPKKKEKNKSGGLSV